MWRASIAGFLGLFIAGLTLVHAQPLTRHRLMLGGGLIPGMGLQLTYMDTGDFITREASGYASFVPALLGGESTLRLSVGAGGSFRLLNVLNMLELTYLPAYQLDLGFRLGPSFFMAFGGEEANPTRLFADLFLRGIRSFPGGRMVYVELGLHEPLLRGGLVFPLHL